MNNVPTVSILLLLTTALVSGCARSARSATVESAAPDATASSRVAGDPARVCAEHHVPLAECGICRPELAATLRPGEGAKVRLAAADSATLAGIRVAPTGTAPVSDGVECYAEIAFNQNRLAVITAPVSGVLEHAPVDAGARVAARQLLARLSSPAITEAVAKAVLARQTVDRERKLRAGHVTSEKDLQQAEADYRATSQYALTLGFSEADVARLATRPGEPLSLEVTAPFAGEVIERTAVQGERVEAGRTLFTLADRSVMWALLAVPEAAAARLRPGQTVTLELEADAGRTFAGRLTWIAAAVDERTRLVRARAELPNPDGALKARMFARARITFAPAENAVVVPPSALQRIDGRDFVFVQLGPDLFEARAVAVGVRTASSIEVRTGLRPDEPVAVGHVFPLKSAFLISRLGAGCADD